MTVLHASSRATERFLVDEDVEPLEEWQSHSLDLFTIETLWWELNKKVFQRKPHNHQELWGYCQEERKHSE